MTHDRNNVPGEKRQECTLPVKFDIDLDKERTSQGDVAASKAWSGLPGTKKDVVMFAAILLLAFDVFHLHGRVDDAETSWKLAMNKKCSCVNGSETRDRDAASSNLQAEDISTHAMEGLGYGLQETQSVDGGDSLNVPSSYFNNKIVYEKIRKEQIHSKEQIKHIPRTQSSNSDFGGFERVGMDKETPLFRTQGKNRPRNYIFQTTLNVLDETHDVEGNTTEVRVADGETHDVEGNTTEVRVADGETHTAEGNTTEIRVADGDVDPSTSNVRVGGGRRRRRDTEGKAELRTGNSPKLRKDHTFANRKRHGGRGQKDKKKSRKLESNSESYEARFFEMFPYFSSFLSKGCISHKLWDTSILGCRDEKILLNHRYSVLPFYLATNETASKHLDQRMLKMNDDKPGEFKVNIPGDYLVQLNITLVVDKTENNTEQFLALFLNGQAMLACHQGGFRCPYTNSDHSNKYKICNIIGLLKLNKNDIVDIRTMDSNMAVRLEKRQNTIFRVVLVNKQV